MACSSLVKSSSAAPPANIIAMMIQAKYSPGKSAPLVARPPINSSPNSPLPGLVPVSVTRLQGLPFPPYPRAEVRTVRERAKQAHPQRGRAHRDKRAFRAILLHSTEVQMFDARPRARFLKSSTQSGSQSVLCGSAQPFFFAGLSVR
ncbi:hypothetical protein D9M70_442470 [compost metagenome]